MQDSTVQTELHSPHSGGLYYAAIAASLYEAWNTKVDARDTTSADEDASIELVTPVAEEIRP